MLAERQKKRRRQVPAELLEAKERWVSESKDYKRKRRTTDIHESVDK